MLPKQFLLNNREKNIPKQIPEEGEKTSRRHTAHQNQTLRFSLIFFSYFFPLSLNPLHSVVNSYLKKIRWYHDHLIIIVFVANFTGQKMTKIFIQRKWNAAIVIGRKLKPNSGEKKLKTLTENICSNTQYMVAIWN